MFMCLKTKIYCMASCNGFEITYYAEVEWFPDSVPCCWLVYFCIDGRCYLSRVLDGSLWVVCLFFNLFFFFGGGGGLYLQLTIKAMFIIYCLTSCNGFQIIYYG